MAATSQAATTTALEEKTMHNEKKTNGKISKTLSNKTSICKKVKEKHAVNINSTKNIERNKNVEKSMGDTQRKPTSQESRNSKKSAIFGDSNQNI